MTDRELMKLALEALDWAAGCIEPLKPINCDCPVCWASNALRERLAQPEHEWLRGECIKCGKSMEPEWQGLAADSTIQTVPAQGGLLPTMKEGKDFTISKPWVGLEEWELSNVYFDATGQGLRLQDKTLVYKFARAIEAKLKEKNE